MIHVLHVLSCLGLGGAERVVLDLVGRTDRSRFRHTICYLHSPDDLAAELRELGCETIRLDAPEHRGWWRGSRALRPILRSRRPDVVHSATFDANLAARLAMIGGPKAPLITWLVSMEYDPESVRAAGWSVRSNRLRRLLDSLTARLSGSSFIACSGAVRRSAIEQLNLDPANIGTIYNPVDPETIQAGPGEGAEARRSLGIGEDAFVWLTIGRLDAAKGHEVTLGAMQRIAASQPDAHLVIVGRGPRRDDFVAKAEELGLAGRVHFIGSAPRIAPYLAAADAFLFPSLLEGLPVALLEAMSAGLPCIASDIEPHVEVVQDGVTGLLVPKGSVDGLARAMERLSGDAVLRDRLGAAGRDHAESHFAAEIVLPQWERAFERAAAAKL
jgi:glycosyltransferase involved in cell wall biosynthesis